MTRYLLVAYVGDTRLEGDNKPTTQKRAEAEKARWEAHVAPLNRFRKAQGKPEYRYAVEAV